MLLNARQVATTKPRDKAYKLADGGGLYIMANINVSKYWRKKYQFAGKEKKLSFGTYPDISLAEARGYKHFRSDSAGVVQRKSLRLVKKLH